MARKTRATKPTPKVRAQMHAFAAQARIVSELTGVGLADLGHWLQYLSEKDSGRETAQDLHAQVPPAPYTPEDYVSELVSLASEDTSAGKGWAEDVYALGKRFDPGFAAPYFPENDDAK